MISVWAVMLEIVRQTEDMTCTGFYQIFLGPDMPKNIQLKDFVSSFEGVGCENFECNVLLRPSV